MKKTCEAIMSDVIELDRIYTHLGEIIKPLLKQEKIAITRVEEVGLSSDMKVYLDATGARINEILSEGTLAYDTIQTLIKTYTALGC